MQQFTYEWKSYVSFILTLRAAGSPLPDALPPSDEAVAEAHGVWSAANAAKCVKMKDNDLAT